MFTKRRRILGGIICITSLLLILSLGFIIGTPKRLNSLFIDDDKYSQITDVRLLNEELDISSLKIAGYEAFVTKDAIYYSLIDGDKYAYNPSINISSPYKVALRGDKISDWSIEHNDAIDVLIYDDDSYREMKLISTTLPLLSLDFQDGKAPEDREDKDFSMRLFDNRSNVINRTVVSDGKSHKRGAISFKEPKANLSIKLTEESVGGNDRKNNVSLLGMQERSNYVLTGMYYDFEKVRDIFGATLWREASADRNEFSLDLSYDWRLVEVIANDEYYGLYLLGYKPDEETFEVNTEGDHPDILFKASDGEDFSYFIMGYSNTVSGYELKSDTDLIESYSVLREYMRAMYSNDISKVLEWSDYNNAVDFWLFTNVTQNSDIPQPYGMMKNSYICFKWNGEHYKAVFIPWDNDNDFGTVSPWGVPYNYEADQNVILDTDMIAAFRRTGDAAIQSVVQKRYNELRQGAWSLNHINELLDIYEKQIFNSGAFARNQERWRESNHIDTDVKLSQFRDFVRERINFTDSNLFVTNKQINTPYEIPNYLTVYLETGEILNPDDPNYLQIQPVDNSEDEPDEDIPEDELVGF